MPSFGYSVVIVPGFEPLEIHGMSTEQKWQFLGNAFNPPLTMHQHKKVRVCVSVCLRVCVGGGGAEETETRVCRCGLISTYIACE